MKPRSLITDAVVARALPRKREYALRDARLPGLALRVQPSGAKSWTLRLRRDGETRRITLGAADAMLADEARARAHALLASETPEPKTAALARAAPPGMTFAALADAFAAAKKGAWRPSSLAKLHVYLRTQLLPAFGPRPANGLSTVEVAAWFHGYARSRPGGANVALSHMRTILLWGQSVGHLEADWADPTKPIRRNRRPPRGALLTAAQLGALGAALDRARREDADAADAVRLILLTGCRSGEILRLAWADVQCDRLRLPRTKTVPRDVLLSAAARAALDQRSASAKTALVFPNPKDPTRPRGNIDRSWRRLRLAAGLPETVRLHDLRHPSVSIETETTQRICSPRRPFLPTVFITSRRMSSSVTLRAASGPSRCAISRRKASISGPAASLKLSSICPPLSICALSIRRVRGRDRRLPCSS